MSTKVEIIDEIEIKTETEINEIKIKTKTEIEIPERSDNMGINKNDVLTFLAAAASIINLLIQWMS